ncbi:MAG: ABC transporter substrate-binding protein [Clostridiales bacterium]
MRKVISITIVIIIMSLSIFSFTTCKSEFRTSNSDVNLKEVNDEKNLKSSDNYVISGKVVFASNFSTIVWRDFIIEFNEKYPDIEIVIENHEDFTKVMKEKIAANNLADVWTVHAEYYSKQQLTDSSLQLDEVFDFTDDYIGYEPFLGANSKIRALPLGVTTSGIVYNKKLFEELGLEVPKTIRKFIEVGKKLKKAGKVGLMTSSKANWPMKYWWQDIPKTISGDGNILNNLTDEEEPFKDGNEVIESYKIFKRLVDADIMEDDPLVADWEPMRKSFKDGNVGMAFLGPWFIPQVTDEGSTLVTEDVGIFPFPYNDNKGSKNVVIQPDVAVSISKNSKNTDAAKVWVDFILNEKYSEVVKVLGFMSARPSRKVDLNFIKEFESYNPNKLDVVVDSNDLKKITSSIPNFNYNDIAVDIIKGKDINTIFNELNKKWKIAKDASN